MAISFLRLCINKNKDDDFHNIEAPLKIFFRITIDNCKLLYYNTFNV